MDREEAYEVLHKLAADDRLAVLPARVSIFQTGRGPVKEYWMLRVARVDGERLGTTQAPWVYIHNAAEAGKLLQRLNRESNAAVVEAAESVYREAAAG